MLVAQRYGRTAALALGIEMASRYNGTLVPVKGNEKFPLGQPMVLEVFC